MKKTILLLISLLQILSLFSCQPTYSEKCGWYCNDETFKNEYFNYCNGEIVRLMDKYSLTGAFEYEEKRYEANSNIRYTFYIYCEDYTIALGIANCNRGDTGFYDLRLFYYNDDRLNENYDDIKSVVEFANEITNIIAYDTKTEENQFEKLYYEALSSDEKYASNYYHFDNSVGNVGYLVFLKPEFSGTGYYYILQKKDSVKPCFYFRFEGLLKPFNAE